MNKPVRIFISYCHEDCRFLKGLQGHMVALKRDGSCAAWTDREILPGDTLNQEIGNALETADIVLLLVSVDFLNSDYCMSKEFKKALQRKKDTGAPRIIPIVTRACDWMSIPELAELKAPLDGKPIKGFQDIDEAYLRVVKEIRKVILGQEIGFQPRDRYSLPKSNEALEFLFDILLMGQPKNRKQVGAMYMERIGGNIFPYDRISLALDIKSGWPVISDLEDAYCPRSKQEFCKLGNELHVCGIFDALKIINELEWRYYRYRIRMDIDLEELKKTVELALVKRKPWIQEE
ncbi:hypothetical protein CXU19_00590 [Akkermansia muciniphila]|jgi:hypothetical protein|uniref:toll/interleukin-1 receptor domain-containing protein n=1 Tax=Akkermansia sp. TaxID=1872421 RepID=UPI000C9C710E|nr:hypothetical protein CXU19_00590 [Akkermansia muciniphila]PNC37608.1 hypothetical protein CXU20_12530 [Akkermansia muciniphila]